MTTAFTPRAYQQIAIPHMRDNLRCALWAGMGMGKTVSTLTILSELLLIEGGPVLVLAPLRVAASTWPDEVGKWQHLKGLTIQPIVGSVDQRKSALRKPADIYTMNYENLPWLSEYLGNNWCFPIVVADESTRLKSFRSRQGGKRAHALGEVAHKKVRRFIQLTGTPSPNGLIDLWGQIWFLDAGQRLGRTFTAFRDRWFAPVSVGNHPSAIRWEPREFAQVQIQDALKDICLSLEAKDWFELDEPITNVIHVDLPAKARELYVQMEKQMFMELESGDEIEAFNAASRTIKCLQIANGAAYVDESGGYQVIHDAKIDALRSIVEEAAGMPVLVAYHFKSDLDRLLKAFPAGCSLDKNPQTIKDWNTGKIPVLFAHPASAGHGLNLQDGGNILAFFGHWWDLEQYQQIIERIGPTRQAQAGHQRPVFIYHIVARKTVDEIVMARRESKREVQDLLMEAMKRKEGE